jgi:hypothetical protein
MDSLHGTLIVQPFNEEEMKHVYLASQEEG